MLILILILIYQYSTQNPLVLLRMTEMIRSFRATLGSNSPVVTRPTQEPAMSSEGLEIDDGVFVLSLALAFEIIPPMNLKGRVEHVVHYLSTGKSMSFPVFFALSSDASVIKHSGPDDKVHFLHRRSLNH